MTSQSRLPFQSFIASPVGKGQTSDPRDIINVRESLKQLKRHQGETNKGYMDAELEKSIQDLQRDEGLSVDGIMYPSGETERALNRNLLGETNAFGSAKAARVDLSKDVGKDQSNHIEDVKQIQKGLATLGFIPKSRGFEANGIMDERISQGILNFQKKYDLRADGKLKPGGMTEKAMNIALRQAVSSGVESEPLPDETKDPDNIPGTNIPDKGEDEDKTGRGPIKDDQVDIENGDTDDGFNRGVPTGGKDGPMERTWDADDHDVLDRVYYPR